MMTYNPYEELDIYELRNLLSHMLVLVQQADNEPNDHATLINKEQLCLKIAEIISDAWFVRMKVESEMIYELIADYNNVISRVMESQVSSDLKAKVEEWEKFIRSHSSSLQTDNEPFHQVFSNNAGKILIDEKAQEMLRSIRKPWFSLNNNSRYNNLASSKQVLIGHSMPVTSIDVSLDHHIMITASGDSFVGKPGELILWDLRTGRINRILKNDCSGRVKCVALNKDATRAVSVDEGGKLCLWDVKSGQCMTKFDCESKQVSGVCITEDGSRAITISSGVRLIAYGRSDMLYPDPIRKDKDDTIILWDLEKKTIIQEIRYHSYNFMCLATTPDGKLGLSGTRNGELVLWDLKSGESLFEIKGHENPVFDIAITADAKYAVSGGSDKDAKVWDLTQRKCIQVFNEHDGIIYAVDISANGNIIAVGTGVVGQTTPNCVKVWDVSKKACMAKFTNHSDAVTSLCLLPTLNEVISGSKDKTVRIWDIADADNWNITKHKQNVQSILITPNKKNVITIGDDPSFLIWDMESGNVFNSFESSSSVFAASLSSDGRYLISGTMDGAIEIRNTESGAIFRKMNSDRERIAHIAVTPDSKRLISVSESGSPELWRFDNGEKLGYFDGHNGSIQCLQITGNGRYALTGSMDRTIRIWDIETIQCVGVLRGHNSDIKALTLTPDGCYVISGDLDGRIYIWDFYTGECIRILLGHCKPIYDLHITGFGNNLISFSCDDAIQIWDIMTWECNKVLQHPRKVFFQSESLASFSQDGRFLFLGDDVKNRVRLYDLKLHETVALFHCQAPVRTCAMNLDPPICLLGDTMGYVYFLELKNFVFDDALHIPTRLWKFNDKINGAGKWDEHLTVCCAYCGSLVETTNGRSLSSAMCNSCGRRLSISSFICDYSKLSPISKKVKRREPTSPEDSLHMIQMRCPVTLYDSFLDELSLAAFFQQNDLIKKCDQQIAQVLGCQLHISEINFRMFLRELQYFEIKSTSELENILYKHTNQIVEYANIWFKNKGLRIINVGTTFRMLFYILACKEQSLQKAEDYCRAFSIGNPNVILGTVEHLMTLYNSLSSVHYQLSNLFENPEIKYELLKKIPWSVKEEAIEKTFDAVPKHEQTLTEEINALMQRDTPPQARKEMTDPRKVITEIEGLLQKENNLEQSFNRMTELINALLLLRQDNNTLKLLHQALPRYNKKNDHKGVAYLLSKMGDIYVILKDLRRAGKCYIDLHNVQKSINNPRGMAQAIGSIGYFSGTYNLEQAIKYTKDAFNIKKEIGHNIEAACSAHNIAIYFQGMNQLDHARQYHQKALELDNKIKNTYGVSRDLWCLGTITERYEEELSYYIQANDIAEEHDYYNISAPLLFNIGLLYLKQNNAEMAISFFQRSEKMYEKISNSLEVQRIHFKILPNIRCRTKKR